MNILITGAASGIGRETANYFLKQGHSVFGLDIAPMPERENFRGFTADITDEGSVLAVRQQLEAVPLDAIVNVAGIHLMTSLVEGDFPRMKKAVDINLTGAMLVNRVFHQNLKANGRIIIVTSEVANLDPLPFNGLYSVTKTALDAYAQALRQELNLLGQKVITLRPGAVETPLCHGSVQATANLADGTKLYKNQAGRFSGLAAKFMGKPVKPEKIATLIYKATTAKRPKLIYKKNRNPGLVLLNVLPKGMQCAIIKWLINR